MKPNGSWNVGLRLRIQPGWHTYWKNPGDSGLPPSVRWTLPPGFEAGPIEWPVPERFREEDLVTYGYQSEVILPVRMIAPSRIAGDSAVIVADLDWLECKEICLPGSATLRLALPVSTQPDSAEQESRLLAEARSRLPDVPSGWSFAAEAGPRAVSLEFTPPADLDPRSVYFYSDTALVVDYAAPQGLEQSGPGWRLTMKPAENATGNPDRLTGVLVVEGRRRTQSMAIEMDTPLRTGDPAPAPEQPTESPSGPRATVYAAALAAITLMLAFLVRRMVRKRTHRT